MLMAATCLLAQTQIALAKLEPANPTIGPAPTSKVVPTGKTTDTKTPIAEDTKAPKIKKIDQYSRTLQFGKDNSFRIVQFSDIWYDGDLDHYLETQKLMENIIKKE